jgi:hypothetical protein
VIISKNPVGTFEDDAERLLLAVDGRARRHPLEGDVVVRCEARHPEEPDATKQRSFFGFFDTGKPTLQRGTEWDLWQPGLPDGLFSNQKSKFG